tara:strand:+ start:164 stop:622 length:459 start_codon:yes stop_codon:yes gene_type:complete
MGTRSLTKVIQTYETSIANEDNNNEVYKERKPITCMYRQYDGYMSGHGAELAKWLSGYTVVNGIPMDKSGPIFNGMDCLAAQMFAHFKTEAGGIYCMHPEAEDCGEDYLYEIEKVGKDILITVYEMGFEDGGTYLLQATPEELLTKIEKDYA